MNITEGYGIRNWCDVLIAYIDSKKTHYLMSTGENTFLFYLANEHIYENVKSIDMKFSVPDKWIAKKVKTNFENWKYAIDSNLEFKLLSFVCHSTIKFNNNDEHKKEYVGIEFKNDVEYIGIFDCIWNILDGKIDNRYCNDIKVLELAMSILIDNGYAGTELKEQG